MLRDKIDSFITSHFGFLRKKNDSITTSYLGLRRWIGIIGMLLPLLCIMGGILFEGLSVQKSVSYYYYTNMRDLLVGLLFCVSMFLITYKGYERIDNIITSVSGIASLFIAFFPCRFDEDSSRIVGILQIESGISNKIHLTSASIFFFLLAMNSMFLFTLSDKDKSQFSENKKIRNKVYSWCGFVILIFLAGVAVFKLVLGEKAIIQYKIILIFETIMLLAFGISWLIKGNILFRDQSS